MSDFKAKMHQNRFRLGSVPGTAWSLQLSLRPDRPPSWNKGDLLLREEDGCRDREGLEDREGKVGDGRGGEAKGGDLLNFA